MTDLQKLSGPRLRALIRKRSDVVVAARQGYIAQRYIAQERGKTNSAAKVLVDADAAWREASDELAARRRHHGGDGPIKREG